MTLNNELEATKKELVLASFEILSQPLAWRNWEKP
jgi:hypothetical protein